MNKYNTELSSQIFKKVFFKKTLAIGFNGKCLYLTYIPVITINCWFFGNYLRKHKI